MHDVSSGKEHMDFSIIYLTAIICSFFFPRKREASLFGESGYPCGFSTCISIIVTCKALHQGCLGNERGREGRGSLCVHNLSESRPEKAEVTQTSDVEKARVVEIPCTCKE